jgi:diacylglycerol kinase
MTNNTRKKFSWRERGNSFGYAWDGLKALMRTEHNAYIHLGLTITAFALGFLLHISRVEFMILIIIMAMVWVTEILNTALEKSMDFISTEKHPQIKLVKDLAAAAVLLTAVAALIVGCLIFIPKIAIYVQDIKQIGFTATPLFSKKRDRKNITAFCFVQRQSVIYKSDLYRRTAFSFSHLEPFPGLCTLCYFQNPVAKSSVDREQ